MHQVVIRGSLLSLRPSAGARRAGLCAFSSAAALVATVAVLAPVSAHAANGLQFAEKVEYETGKTPEAIATGDLNGDGKPDMVVANKAKNTVSVLINNGHGTFQPQSEYATGAGPVALALADLNGDGKLDIVTANSTAGSVSVLLGNGDGTFKAQVEYAAGTTPTAIAVGPLTEAHAAGKIPDLVVADKGENAVAVLLNEGNGTFKVPPKQFLTAEGATPGEGPAGVALADLNGDGRPDIVTANSVSNNVSVLLGNGDGTFGEAKVYPSGEGPLGVALADLNGDGKKDIVTANATASTVSVLLGKGDGTFAPKHDFATGKGPSAVAVADLSADGKPDLATANSKASTLSVLLGNGDGTFAGKAEFPAGTGPQAIAVTDLNGDGKPDIATANASANTASVLLDANVGVLSASPSSLSFPAQLFGTKSAAQKVTVTNTGAATLAIGAIAIGAKSATAASSFSASGCSGSALAVGASCALNITFTPKGYGEQKAEATVESNGGSKTIKLLGSGLPPLPVVTTGEVSEIVGSYATLTGKVISQGPGSFYFQYGTTSAYGSVTPTLSLSSSTSPQLLASTLSLEPGFTYHYRLVATNLAGTVAGADQVFTVPPEEPLLSVLKHGRLASVLKRGLRLRVGETSPALVKVQLLVDAPTARFAHLISSRNKRKTKVVVGTGRVTLARSGAKTITVRFASAARRRLAALGKLKLTIIATPSTLTGIAGSPAEITAQIRR